MNKEVCFEVNDRCPNVLERFIGQEQVVNRIKVALEASWADGVRMPHMLFSGGPGLGKTQLAHIISKEMGSEIKETLAQNLKYPELVKGFLLSATEKDILLVDEIHEMPTESQTCLYRALENGTIFVGQKNSKTTRSLPLARFTLIGGTTDPHCLLKPLMDRFKLILSFDYYNHKELEILLRQRAQMLGWDVEDNVFSLIARRSRGTPRLALRLMESCRRTTRSQGDSILTIQYFYDTCELESIDDLGLTADERRYLSILNEHQDPVRLNILAMRTGLHRKTVSDIIEPFLIRIGLITKSDKGRSLTEKGKERLKKTNIIPSTMSR